MILSRGCSTAGGGVVLRLVVVTSAEATDVRRLVILALAVNIVEFVSSACNTSASMSSSLVASRIFPSNSVIMSCLH